MKLMAYAKAKAVEGWAADYEKRGFRVVLSPIDMSFPFETRKQPYSIVATKEDHRVAIEVIAFPRLGREAMRIAKLRLQAYEEGFDDFRLIVVREPKMIPMSVEELEQTLSDYMIRETPDEVIALSDEVRVKFVKHVTVEDMSIHRKYILVRGSGTVIVDIYYDQEGERFWEDDDFSFMFDVMLDHDLKLIQVHQIEVDTSPFWDLMG